MAPVLTWLDLTASDRDKMRGVLDLFKEQGTIDEMGLGTLRDAFSDALFPGTSTIQTRLRYVLFIPWLYQRLEEQRIDATEVATRIRRAELALIDPLKKNEDFGGIIGILAKDSLTRLPSSVYWTALVRWRIFCHERSQGWYHTHFGRLADGRGGGYVADDPGVTPRHQSNWHPRMPKPPDSFPDEASFALTHDEAEFLRGRLEERCAGTLLAWLAREGLDGPSDGCFWDDGVAHRANAEIRQTMERARRFSLHVEGMPLLYNLLLAERSYKIHGKNEGCIGKYQNELAEWAAMKSGDNEYDPRDLWEFAASRGVIVPDPQRRFVESWSRRIAKIGPAAVSDDDELRKLIEHRERQLKRQRARLGNPSRLLDWNGRVGVGRMNFRWPRVRQLMDDLHRGLDS